jgi:glycine oxidase
MHGLAIGIAGAGLLGRLLAWQLARDGHRVTVFDPASGPAPMFDGHGAAAFSAAGMLSPLAEMESGGADVASLGWRSIARWREVVAQLDARPSFAERGSLLLAHRSDLGTARRVLARLSGPAGPQALSAEQLADIEPEIQGPAHAWLLPGEAQIDPVGTLTALHAEAEGVAWRWGRRVLGLQAGALQVDDGAEHRFDWMFDVRGVGARPDLPVRGVRGETAWLHAPGHGLRRPVRLLHPRHRVYIVPRPGDRLIVGASELESEDRSPASLRSVVELMAAAHSVMPALAEARVLRLDTNLRPALPDNLPRIEVSPGLVRINGLFRHGWLMAPALVDDALSECGLRVTQPAEAVA